MDFMLAALGVAFAALYIWLIVRVVNRREKSRRMIWATAFPVVALLGYLLSFGPACRLADEGLIPDSIFMTAYRPCIRISYDGAQVLHGPLQWWVEQCGGETALMMAIVRDWMDSPSLFEHAEEVVRQVYAVVQEKADAKSHDDEPVPDETEPDQDSERSGASCNGRS
jgi:hypothetical protein